MSAQYFILNYSGGSAALIAEAIEDHAAFGPIAKWSAYYESGQLMWESLGMLTLFGISQEVRGQLLERMDELPQSGSTVVSSLLDPGGGSALLLSYFEQDGRQTVTNGNGHATHIMDDLTISAYFLEGRLDGPLRHYYHGRLREEMTYRRGTPHGMTFHWTEDGNINMIGHYEDGCQAGMMVWWDDDGKVYAVNRYENDDRIPVQGWEDGERTLKFGTGYESDGDGVEFYVNGLRVSMDGYFEPDDYVFPFVSYFDNLDYDHAAEWNAVMRRN